MSSIALTLAKASTDYSIAYHGIPRFEGGPVVEGEQSFISDEKRYKMKIVV